MSESLRRRRPSPGRRSNVLANAPMLAPVVAIGAGLYIFSRASKCAGPLR